MDVEKEHHHAWPIHQSAPEKRISFSEIMMEQKVEQSKQTRDENGTVREIEQVNVKEVLQRFRVSEPNHISGHVFLSSFLGAKNIEILRALHITHIVVSGAKLVPYFPQEIKYLCLELDDVHGEDILSYFPRVYEFMDEAQQHGNVLVHCAAGVSRSATLVIAYLMRKLSVSYLAAREITASSRPVIKPNPAFQRQLKIYERFVYSIQQKAEIYLLWKLECLGKQAKKNPLSMVSSGMDPKLYMNEDVIKQLYQLDEFKQSCGPYSQSPSEEVLMYCCKRCERWLFTKLNVEPFSTDEYYFIDRMSWMKTFTTVGKLSCPHCNIFFGDYNLIHETTPAENVSLFRIQAATIKSIVVPLVNFFHNPAVVNYQAIRRTVSLRKKTRTLFLNHVDVDVSEEVTQELTEINERATPYDKEVAEEMKHSLLARTQSQPASRFRTFSQLPQKTTSSSLAESV